MEDRIGGLENMKWGTTALWKEIDGVLFGCEKKVKGFLIINFYH